MQGKCLASTAVLANLSCLVNTAQPRTLAARGKRWSGRHSQGPLAYTIRGTGRTGFFHHATHCIDLLRLLHLYSLPCQPHTHTTHHISTPFFSCHDPKFICLLSSRKISPTVINCAAHTNLFFTFLSPFFFSLDTMQLRVSLRHRPYDPSRFLVWQRITNCPKKSKKKVVVVGW